MGADGGDEEERETATWRGEEGRGRLLARERKRRKGKGIDILGRLGK